MDDKTHDTQIKANGAIFKSGNVSLALSTNVPLSNDEQGGVSAEFVLAEGKSQVFILRDDCADGVPCPPSEKGAEELLRGTVKLWHDWLSACTYHGRWRDQVRWFPDCRQSRSVCPVRVYTNVATI
jgi:hypothetical protein